MAGVVISDLSRNERELREIGKLFTRLLVGSEHRGPHATGVAVISATGGHYVAKAPVPASEFVKSRDYGEVLGGLDINSRLLMGHTRWPTRGSHLDNANNHPLVGKGRRPCIISHNGHISNHQALSLALGLRRTVQVDSEVILRLAEKSSTEDGIDPIRFADCLTLCRGRFSVIAVATGQPNIILLAKGNQPLEVWRHKTRGLLAYASEMAILDEAVGSEPGWEEVRIQPWTLVVADVTDAISLTAYAIPHSSAGRDQSCP